MKGYIFIWAVTLLGAAGAVVDPVIGLFAYVLFSILRPQFLWGYSGSFAGISQYVGVVMLISWAVRGVTKWKLKRGRLIVILLVLFTIWAAISATQARNSQVSYDWVIELLKVTLPFLVGATLVESQKQVRWMLFTIVIAQGYVAYVMNSTYFFAGFNRAQELGFGGMDNNSFAISLVTTLGPALAMILLRGNWGWRIAGLASAALIMHTVLLTFSRGAMLGLLASGLTAFVILPKRPRYIVVLVIAGALLVRLTGPQLLARWQTTFAEADERDPSAESRVVLWAACLDLVSHNPFLGIGPRNFPVVARDYGFTPGKEAHSVWMQTAAEMGIPGVAFLLLFYVVTVVKLWPLARAKLTPENADEKIIATGVIAGVVGFVISGQFVSLVGLETPYYVVMLGTALLGATRSPVKAMPSVPSRSPLPWETAPNVLAGQTRQTTARI